MIVENVQLKVKRKKKRTSHELTRKKKIEYREQGIDKREKTWNTDAIAYTDQKLE